MEISILTTTFVLMVAMCTGGSTCPSDCQSCDGGRINCPGAGLRSPPTMPEDTLLIDLSQNQISEIQGRQFQNLPNVQSMRMAGNKLQTVPALAFESMTQLMSLDLSQNVITEINDNAFSGLSDLRTISLNGNQILSIGHIFAETRGLTSIRLGNNLIDSLEDENFENTGVLRMLDLSNNEIATISSKAFANLPRLRYLILSNNPITTLPDLEFSSTMLQLADFSNCQLTTVPRTMPPSLRDFRLGNNEIAEILEDDFNNITSLQLITMNDNKIRNIAHRAFGKLENLRELWLTRNYLIYIPRGLPANLQKLYMDSNEVVDFEKMLFKPNSKLKYLTLEMNRIKRVDPAALEDVNQTEEINLQGNLISMLPADLFKDMPKLKKLRLSSNPIQLIENGAFGQLPELTSLMMSHLEYPAVENVSILNENFLTSMPKLQHLDLTASINLAQKLIEILADRGTPEMSNLTSINLQYNDIMTLPETLRQVLRNTESILLDGNMFTCDKRLAWLADWMRSSSKVFYSTEEPICTKPGELRGMAIATLSQSQFVDEVTEPQVEEPVEAEIRPLEPVEIVEEESQTQPHGRIQPDLPSDVGTHVVVKAPSGSSRPNSGNQRGTVVVVKAPSGSTRPDKGEKVIPAKPKKKKKGKKSKLSKEERRRRKLARRKKQGRKRRHLHQGKKGRRCRTMDDGTIKCRRRKNKNKSKSGPMIEPITT